MTILFQDRFESGTLLTSEEPAGAWDSKAGTIAIDATAAKSGTYSAKVTAATSGIVFKSFTDSTTLYNRGYYRFDNINETNWNNHEFIRNTGNSGANRISYVELQKHNDAAGIFKWFIHVLSGAGTADSPGAAVTIDTTHWYCVELKTVVHASAGECRLYIDGVETQTLTELDTDAQGAVDSTYHGLPYLGAGVDTVHVDSVVISDAYIGPESFITNHGDGLNWMVY